MASICLRFPEGTSTTPVTITVYEPYICVTERFGLNCVVINSRTGIQTSFTRTDNEASISSFSTGFLQREERVLFIHQTEWNRLDITDLETGILLTKRVVSQEAKINYIDYYHSLLHVSPDSKHFLSNGWFWHPAGVIHCFNTDEFFHSYDSGSSPVDFIGVYNWDRPCTFIDNSVFVMAADQEDSDTTLNNNEIGATYRQLWFYNIKKTKPGVRLQHFKTIACEAFPLEKEGEVYGSLAYDKFHNVLVAINKAGAYAVSLEGKILQHYNFPATNLTPFDVTQQTSLKNWQYSPNQHCFYHYDNETHKFSIESLKITTSA